MDSNEIVEKTNESYISLYLTNKENEGKYELSEGMMKYILSKPTHQVNKYWSKFLQSYIAYTKYDHIRCGEKQLLEQWTGMKCKTILFNSDFDNWCYYKSVFNTNLNGKNHLLFVIIDDNNEKFGYYFDPQFQFPRKEWDRKVDRKSFHFNLQSNGRLKQPMKFEISSTYDGKYLITEKDVDSEVLVRIGDIELYKKEMKYSKCYQQENNFDYKGIKSALNGNNDNFFIVKKIIVIQME